MSLSFVVTPQDFKNLFFRDFNYQAVLWVITDTYNTDDIVYYTNTRLYYKALNDALIGVLPTDTNNWEQTPDDNYVLDEDIEKAFDEACLVFNEKLFGEDEATKKLAFLYLTAHYLVIDLNNASNSLDTGGSGGSLASRSVGNVSESYNTPKWATENETLAPLAQTSYGKKYYSLIKPRLIAPIFVVEGATLP
jgi:hypothetical protein